MERWEAKLISLFGMFIILFVCMALPIKVSAIVNRQGEHAGRILGLLRCFAGGVFLGTILLHMVPEVHDQIQEFLLEPRGINYPIAELVIAGGFFFICIFERTALTIHARNKKSKVDSVALTGQVMVSTHVNAPEGTPCALNMVMDDAEGHDNSAMSMGSNIAMTANGVHGNGEVVAVTKKSQISAENGTISVANGKVAEGEVAGGTSGELDDNDIAKTRSIVLVLALAFECIFDGLSVGLQMTQSGTWNMFIAIVSHEFIISFCLGIELVKYHSSKKVLFAAFSYAMIPPIGCAVGMIITETDMDVNADTLEIVSGLLIAMAAGIFLYCTFIGMLGEELITDATFEKILVTAIGCGIMAGLAALPADDGEEDEDGVMTTIAAGITDHW